MSDSRIYQKARISILYSDGSKPDLDLPCQVRFEGGRIVIGYDYEGGTETYMGHELSSGHYRAACLEIKCAAMIHHLPDSRWIDMRWETEGGNWGTGTINLGQRWIPQT